LLTVDLSQTEPGEWAEKISDLKGDLAKKEALDKQARKDLKKSPNDPAANQVRVDVQAFKDQLDLRMRYYEARKNLEEATEDKKTSVEDLKKFGEAADLAKKSWESYEAVNKEKEKVGADDSKEEV